MQEKDTRKSELGQKRRWADDKGSAIVIALFVLALISAFAIFTLSKTANEAVAVGNEAAEGRAFYASQGSLETMTRNFNKLFEVKLNPLPADITSVENADVSGLSRPAGRYDFLQEVDQTSDSTTTVLSGGPFSGLYAIRDNWRLRTTATDESGTQVRLTRNILNNRIPIFQFGVFYDDDLELFRPPLFSFGGRVHSNRHFFISPGAEGVYFDSRVTAVGHIITQSWRNGYSGDSANNQTFIKNASGVNRQLLPGEGSLLNGTPNVFASQPDLPSSRINPSWPAQSAKFDGNLQSEVKPLRLPMTVGSGVPLIEMIKRGKKVTDLYDANGILTPVTVDDADNAITRAERFANKTGIRISLADSKAKLPGCASGSGTAAVVTACGVRLDGHLDGSGIDPIALPSPLPSPITASIALSSRGYQARPMKLSTTDAGFSYVPTRVNGARLHGDLSNPSRQIWIKIETVSTNDVDGSIVTQDITEDILSLGVTEESPLNIAGYTGIKASDINGTPTSPSLNITLAGAQTASTYPDSRSIVKLQRFAIPGAAMPDYENRLTHNSGRNYVRRFANADDTDILQGCPSSMCDARDSNPNSGSDEIYGHLKRVGSDAIVAFPIKLFDTREGLYYDDRSTAYYSDTYYDGLKRISRNGTMSLVDLDVANLRRFLRGDFNDLFPTNTPFASAKGSGLENDDIPQEAGWVLYFSDRRGDADFDGEFDMEDVYGSAPGNDGSLQAGEDTDPLGSYGHGALNVDYTSEASRYRDNTVYTDTAAVNDHRYFRRGLRLVNGATLPGIYDSGTPANTRGFTVSSENGVYVLGNYNATNVTSVPSTGNTPSSNYRPLNDRVHIPASIVADAVTVLSNSWNDAKSYISPYDEAGRLGTETTIRFAMISGDTIASREAAPNQGGLSPRLNGGVHNFKRFLERWTGANLNYSGSLINLYNSQNNNGSFKCCNTVYDPPRRNWVFDNSFLDPTRLPPGTPYFQYVQTTGFQRSND